MGKAGKKTEELFEREEYQQALDRSLAVIQDTIGECTNEAMVADHLEKQFYKLCSVIFPMAEEELFPRREAGCTGHGVSQKFAGRMDSLYHESFLIEYKHWSRLETAADQEKAIHQIETYMRQLGESENGKQEEAALVRKGLLTDGKRVMFFGFLNGRLKHTPFQTFSRDSLDRIIRSIVWKDRKIFVPENMIRDFSVCRGETCGWRLAQIFFEELAPSVISDSTRSLMREWEVLFHLSESDSGQSGDIAKRQAALSRIFGQEIRDNQTEYRALYALQTTYAIIVKLTACKVVTKLMNPGQAVIYFEDMTGLESETLRNLLFNIENGYTMPAMGIRNLLEGDFFSWYCSKDQWNGRIFLGLVSVLEKLENYAYLNYGTEDGTIDMFRELYMEVMPNEVRHSLGEYYTPAWLADRVVRESIRLYQGGEKGAAGKHHKGSERKMRGGWRAIDPCCGSGVFLTILMEAVKEEYRGKHQGQAWTEEENQELLFEILNRVQGVDLNPLSVLTARVSYFIAIQDLIQRSSSIKRQPIEIPVYLGDSANPAEIISVGGVSCYQVNIMIHEGQVLEAVLPVSFVKSPDFYVRMGRLETLSRSVETERLAKQFTEYLGEEGKAPELQEKIGELCGSLVEMRDQGITVNYLRIITNYMRTAQLGNLDLIVGNPPWVKWEHLPQNYAEKIKKRCLDRHLFSGQSYMGAISLNICALIANMTVSHWMNSDGVLAFLMPYALLTQDSYEGFRSFYLDDQQKERMYLQQAEDWSKSGHPFIYTTEPFVSYYYRKEKQDYHRGIPVKFMEKKQGLDIRVMNGHSRFEEVRECFQISSGTAVQMDQKRTGYTVLRTGTGLEEQLRSMIGECAYKARSGVEFTPNEVYWLRYDLEKSTDMFSYFERMELNAAKYKSAFRSSFILETDYIRPLIRGPQIGKFSIADAKEYCIFPYEMREKEQENGWECTLVSATEMVESSENLLDYLTRNQALIEGQSKRSRAIQRGDEFYALSKVGAYTFFEAAVAFRDNTRMAAAVVKPVITEWGMMKTPVCAKHAPYISMDKNGNYITEDEAYYISAILNTPVVEEYFRRTYSGRAYSIKFNLCVPKYDPADERHVRLMTLSRKAHEEAENGKQTEHFLQEMQVIYLELCREQKEEQR